MIDIREAADVMFLRESTGMAHVGDADALQALYDGRCVFDVDPHCRKLEAWIDRNKVWAAVLCRELLPGGGEAQGPVYFTRPMFRGRKPGDRRPAA